jgi:hypothetical protein
MPQVNGNNYRTFGQGYGAEKAKMAAGSKDREVGSSDDKGGQKGSVMHVKHLGGGKFSAKSDSGEVTQHDSADELHAHMAQHFGLNASEGNEDSEDSYDDDGDEGSEVLKSILG